MSRLPKVVRRATDQTEAEKRAVTDQINKAAGQLADLWDADRRSAGVHLPDLRRYLNGLTEGQRQRGHPPPGGHHPPEDTRVPVLDPAPAPAHPAIEAEDDPPALP